jgi:hypothetical protein
LLGKVDRAVSGTTSEFQGRSCGQRGRVTGSLDQIPEALRERVTIPRGKADPVKDPKQGVFGSHTDTVFQAQRQLKAPVVIAGRGDSAPLLAGKGPRVGRQHADVGDPQRLKQISSNSAAAEADSIIRSSHAMLSNLGSAVVGDLPRVVHSDALGVQLRQRPGQRRGHQ